MFTESRQESLEPKVREEISFHLGGKISFFELFYSVKQDNEYIYNNDDIIIEFAHTTPSFLHS